MFEYFWIKNKNNQIVKFVSLNKIIQFLILLINYNYNLNLI